MEMRQLIIRCGTVPPHLPHVGWAVLGQGLAQRPSRHIWWLKNRPVWTLAKEPKKEDKRHSMKAELIHAQPLTLPTLESHLCQLDLGVPSNRHTHPTIRLTLLTGPGALHLAGMASITYSPKVSSSSSSSPVPELSCPQTSSSSPQLEATTSDSSTSQEPIKTPPLQGWGVPPSCPLSTEQAPGPCSPLQLPFLLLCPLSPPPRAQSCSVSPPSTHSCLWAFASCFTFHRCSFPT